MEKRESFVICRHWIDAINALPVENQLETYKALGEYGLTGQIPQDISPLSHAILLAFSKEMDNNIARYNASIENGRRGGRPSKKAEEEEKTSEKTDLNEENSKNSVSSKEPSLTQQNLEEPNLTQQNLDKPSNNLEKPSQTQQNLEEPNHNLYDNDYVNDYDNVSSLSIKYKNNSLNRVRACETEEEIVEFLKEFYRDYYAYWGGVEVYKQNFEKVLSCLASCILDARKNALKFNHKRYSEDNFIEVLAKLDEDDIHKIVWQMSYNDEIKNKNLYILGAIINRSLESKK